MTGTEAAVAADVNGEATVEERLAGADRRIQALDRDVKVLGILVVGLVVAGVVSWVLNELAFSHPAPSNRDATEADLLTGGVHCYDSPEERAAARQRALAAIDRMEWERELRTEPGGGGQIWGTAAPIGPNEIPSIWDSPANLASLNADPALCFSVQYLLTRCRVGEELSHGDELVLRPIELTAAQATRLRRRASRNGRTMPMSQYERDLYAAAGLEPPTC